MYIHTAIYAHTAMYIHTAISVHTGYMCMCACTYIAQNDMRNLYVCISFHLPCVCVCVHICTHTHTCIHTYISLSLSLCTHTHTHTHTPVPRTNAVGVESNTAARNKRRIKVGHTGRANYLQGKIFEFSIQKLSNFLSFAL